MSQESGGGADADLGEECAKGDAGGLFDDVGGAAWAEVHGMGEVVDGDGGGVALVDEVEDPAVLVGIGVAGRIQGGEIFSDGLEVHVAEPLFQAGAKLAEEFHGQVRFSWRNGGDLMEEVGGAGGWTRVGDVGMGEGDGCGAFGPGEEDHAQRAGVGDGDDPFDEPGMADFHEAFGVGFEPCTDEILIKVDAAIEPVIFDQGARRGKVEGAGGR